MTKRKNIRSRGKISLEKYFQKFEDGDTVAVTVEQSVDYHFPKRLQGRTGVIAGKKGKTYIVKINDQEKPKQFLIEPVHLKRIKQKE